MNEASPSFSDEQAALILQRAAELQARGLSLRELEAAAAEAGIDAALVRRAADEVATLGVPPAPPAPTSPISPISPIMGGALGAPLHLVHERVVPGEGSGLWEEEVAEIRRHLGITGRVELAGRALAWRGARGRKIQVTIVARGGRRLIRVEERVGDLAGGLFLAMGLPMTFAGLGFILPICLAVLEMPLLIPVAFVVWAGLTFLLARTIFKAVVSQRDPELRMLADGLAEVCRDAPSEPYRSDGR